MSNFCNTYPANVRAPGSGRGNTFAIIERLLELDDAALAHLHATDKKAQDAGVKPGKSAESWEAYNAYVAADRLRRHWQYSVSHHTGHAFAFDWQYGYGGAMLNSLRAVGYRLQQPRMDT